MSIEMKVHFIGLHELRKKFSQIVKGIDKAVPIIRNTGKIMRIEMQVMAPIDTGELHDRIEDRDIPTGVQVESGAPYSGYPEYGTRYQRPQPFFNPAIYNNRHRILEGIIKEVTG